MVGQPASHGPAASREKRLAQSNGMCERANGPSVVEVDFIFQGQARLISSAVVDMTLGFLPRYGRVTSKELSKPPPCDFQYFAMPPVQLVPLGITKAQGSNGNQAIKNGDLAGLYWAVRKVLSDQKPEKVQPTRRINLELFAFLMDIPAIYEESYWWIFLPVAIVVPYEPAPHSMEQNAVFFVLLLSKLNWNIGRVKRSVILPVNSVQNQNVGERHDRCEKWD
jgi:hypothetical protein